MTQPNPPDYQQLIKATQEQEYRQSSQWNGAKETIDRQADQNSNLLYATAMLMKRHMFP